MILLKTSDDGNGGIRQQEFYFISAPQGSLWTEDYTAYIVDDITGENITNQSLYNPKLWRLYQSQF